MYKVNIKKIPSIAELRALIDDAEVCIQYYGHESNSLTYDHLENRIAKILGLALPNPELEVD